MEYVLFAFSDSQQPIKTRLSKLRHLDSLFFFLLIIALLSFNILQQRQLREEILSHRADHLLDELLQERIPHLERQVEELKGMFSEENAMIQQRLRENKQLTIQLGRELGLPFTADRVAEQQGKAGEKERAEIREIRSYEIIEIQPNSEEEDSEQRGESSEDSAESDVIPLEEVITTAEQTCTYMQYLYQAGESSQRSVWSRPSRQQFWINTSSHIKRGEIQIGHHLTKDNIMRILQGLGKMLLVVILIVVVLMLTIQKKRKGKNSKSFMRDLWKKVWPEERRRLKEWKQQKDLLVL